MSASKTSSKGKEMKHFYSLMSRVTKALYILIKLICFSNVFKDREMEHWPQMV